jgi:RNA polymerase sigma-70 factor (ECF subfamily)
MSPFVDAFVASLPAGDEVSTSDPALEVALETAIGRGAAAHPTIPLDGGLVAAHLGAHADDTRPAAAWLPTRNLADVHLVCGILHRVPAALAQFQDQLVPEMQRAATRLLGSDRAVDVVSAVREKLVVGLDARGPRIADYGGHGELVVWLRVITIRAALSELRRDQRLISADDTLWDAASPSADPALTILKQESAALIKTAFHAGLAALTPRQRNLLRQHLLDGLTIDELGVIYGIHRVTAARWLAAARADLWSHTRRQLRQTLGLSDTAIGGMLEEIRSTLDLSIERALSP